MRIVALQFLVFSLGKLVCKMCEHDDNKRNASAGCLLCKSGDKEVYITVTKWNFNDLCYMPISVLFDNFDSAFENTQNPKLWPHLTKLCYLT